MSSRNLYNEPSSKCVGGKAFSLAAADKRIISTSAQKNPTTRRAVAKKIEISFYLNCNCVGYHRVERFGGISRQVALMTRRK